MFFRLTDRVAVVTSCEDEVGEAIVAALAIAGAKVVIASGGEKAEQVCADLEKAGYKVAIKAGDLMSGAGANALAKAVVDEYGALDILVNNPDINAMCSVTDVSDEQWKIFWDTNVTQVFNMCRAAVPYMREKKDGKIINIGSVAGKQGYVRTSPVYSCTKGAVMAFTRQLAMQEADYNIKVNAVAPGLTRFEIDSMTAEQFEEITKDRLPMPRPCGPEEVGSAVLYLAADSSNYVVGETIDVNGGFYVQ